MSKIDDMRRQREVRVAESARRAASEPKRAAVVAPAEATKTPAVLAVGEAEPAQPTRSESTDGDADARCSGCGKTKPVTNGLMANHQQGLGKQCPGSRKPPATAED